MSINLKQAASKLDDFWSPKVVGELNGQYVKVAKVKGELAWHKHDREDEMFLVLEGSLCIEYQDRPDALLVEGECHIVPMGVMHNPVCEKECLIALFEPAETRHTGDLVIEKTVAIEDQL